MDDTEYLYEDFIIWNPTLGIRDLVTIGEIKTTENTTQAWLDDPYDMVGPFSLDELLTKGEISFEACVVMTKEKWQKDQKRLKKESYKKQQKIHEEFYNDINRHNKRKRESYNSSDHLNEKDSRQLLNLPLEGVLKVTQIKTAFRKVAKSAHPDVGGSHEKFVQITKAKDALLVIFQ